MAADQLKLPYIYVRPKPKEHGLSNQIEGFYEKGQKVPLFAGNVAPGARVPLMQLEVTPGDVTVTAVFERVDSQTQSASVRLTVP